MAIWEIGGDVSPSGEVRFDPLFTVPADNMESRAAYLGLMAGGFGYCKGDYTLEVDDANGKAISSCNITLMTSVEETGPGMGGKPDSHSPISRHFYTQMAARAAAAIVLKDPQNKELDRIMLLGAPPNVTLLNPGAGFVGKGLQKITWKVETDKPAFTSRVLFSQNGGREWVRRGDLKNSTFVTENFDGLPGSDGRALIRILVSDGVNTGYATSAPFSIARKNIVKVGITNPEDHRVIQGSGYTLSGQSHNNEEVVFLSGYAGTIDDGTLEGDALVWSSDIQGKLGTGNNVEAHLKPGRHIVTLRATDMQGHSASLSREVTITPWIKG